MIYYDDVAVFMYACIYESLVLINRFDVYTEFWLNSKIHILCV